MTARDTRKMKGDMEKNKEELTGERKRGQGVCHGFYEPAKVQGSPREFESLKALDVSAIPSIYLAVHHTSAEKERPSEYSYNLQRTEDKRRENSTGL